MSSEYFSLGIFLKVPMNQIECFDVMYQKHASTILLKIIDYWLCNTEEKHRLEYLLAAVEKLRRSIYEVIKMKYKDEDFKGKCIIIVYIITVLIYYRCDSI